MELAGPIARRFPLVARTRPVCRPLPARVSALTELAASAQREDYHGIASSVFNQAALLAADLGLPDLARQWCRRHALAYLNACPLSGMDAIRALEPVVNLARLYIRGGQEDDGYQLLLTMNKSVTSGSTSDFGAITVPENLTATELDHQEVRQWLWRVLIADGTRALTTAGRWQDALSLLRQHHGIGQRMLDGRQVAVLASVSRCDYDAAEQILAGTTPGDPWENAVTACLMMLCKPPAWQPKGPDVEELTSAYSELDLQPGLSVFSTRLFLAVLDASRQVKHLAITAHAGVLADWVAQNQDGYAAREILRHDVCVRLLSAQQKHDLAAAVNRCALASQAMPPQVHTALDSCEALITRTLARR